MRSLYRPSPFVLLILFLVSTFILVTRHDSDDHYGSRHDSQPEKPAHNRLKSAGMVTHIRTKLKLPESRFLEVLPSRETTQIIVPNDRIIVMARLSFEDTNWVPGDLADWRYLIYTVDNQNAVHHTPKNKGKESLAYLQYIVDHYDDLPSTIVFLHAHKIGYPQSWHVDNGLNDNAESVRTLQLDYVQRNGYVNLRCQHNIGCPVSVRPSLEPHDIKTVDDVYRKAWMDLFNNTDVPEYVGVPCCSQFAVSKNQVLQRPLNDYRWFYQWVLENDLPDNLTAGVMENMWHIIFGQAPMYCPDIAQCYADVYGITDVV